MVRAAKEEEGRCRAAPATKGKTAPVKAVVKKAPAKPDPKKKPPAKKLEVAAGFNGFKFPWDK